MIFESRRPRKSVIDFSNDFFRSPDNGNTLPQPVNPAELLLDPQPVEQSRKRKSRRSKSLRKKRTRKNKN